MNIDEIAEVLRKTRNAPQSPKTFQQALENALRTLGKLSNKTTAEQRLQRAIAEHYPRVEMPITMRAKASKRVHTVDVDIVITPLDKPNANKQLVPSSEKDNIITSAQYKPIRANFTGLGIKGHEGAREIGAITSVYAENNVIYGTGVIWTENDEDLEDYLLDKKQVGSSWEMYYRRSENKNGIEHLFDIVFASQCLVKNPAYGSDTPVKVRA